MWVRRFAHRGGQEGIALAVDRWGDAYVLASHDSATTGSDVLLVKYSRTGKRLWHRRYTTRGKHDEYARSLALDQAGRAYIAGTGWKLGRQDDVLLLKYRRDGTRAWRFYWDHLADRDYGTALAVDAQGNSYVTGYSHSSTTGGVAVMRVGADGVLDWADIPPLVSNGIEHGREIAVRGGTVAVAADVSSMATGDDIWTLTYSTSGVRGWMKGWNYDDFDFANAIAIDAVGEIFVAGECMNPQGGALPENRAVLLKWSAGGALLSDELYWNESIADGQAWFDDMALARDGSVYCSGGVIGDSIDGLMVEFSPAGARVRVVAYDRRKAKRADWFNSVSVRTLSDDGPTVLYCAGSCAARNGWDNALVVRLRP